MLRLVGDGAGARTESFSWDDLFPRGGSAAARAALARWMDAGAVECTGRWYRLADHRLCPDDLRAQACAAALARREDAIARNIADTAHPWLRPAELGELFGRVLADPMAARRDVSQAQRDVNALVTWLDHMEEMLAQRRDMLDDRAAFIAEATAAGIMLTQPSSSTGLDDPIAGDA